MNWKEEFIKLLESGAFKTNSEIDDYADGHNLSVLEVDADIRMLYRSFGETKVTGFPEQEHPSVYREGMALKFFGDLVCDYLGEERIVRTY